MRQRPLVIKFGGTSVGGGAEMVRAANVAAEAAQDGPVAVVVSAMAGTTDTLLGYADATATASSRTSTGATREGSITELYRTLADRHLGAAREALSGEHLPEVEEHVHSLLKRLIDAVEEPPTYPAARRDQIAVHGERLSAAILAGAIRSLDMPAAVVPGDPIATNCDFGKAEVLVEETRRRAGQYVRPLLEAGSVAVVPGYVGRAPDGSVTTLGRGGSDLSTTVLGRALDSREVWIMSDVDGVLDADPRLIPDAGLIPHLSYREAGQFSALGAKVLHPQTTAPAAAAGIEIHVRSTFNPDSSGTRISDREGGPGVRSVALRRGLSLTHVPPEAAENIFCVLGADAEGLKVLADGATGDVAAVFCLGAPTDRDFMAGLRCLHRANIELLFAGNTSTGLLFAVAGRDAEAALRALHRGLIPATPRSEVVPVKATVETEEVA